LSEKDHNLIYSYKYCENIAKKHYENFPVGSLLIPKEKRKYIYSIYAFARYADDIADSKDLEEAEKLRILNSLGSELIKIEEGNVVKLNNETKNFLLALSNTINELRVPVREFENLLIAFKQDALKQRYKDFNELIRYSEHSANPIGHLVLLVFGYDIKKDKEVFQYSDKICTALQLTNFWQDVSIDLAMNRIYIPGDEMSKHLYDYEMLNKKVENEDFRIMMKSLVDRTRIIFKEGESILKLLKGRLLYEIKATYAGGNEILNKIEKINYNVLSQRVGLKRSDKLSILLKTIF
jgi:squalene synthase HpnC